MPFTAFPEAAGCATRGDSVPEESMQYLYLSLIEEDDRLKKCPKVGEIAPEHIEVAHKGLQAHRRCSVTSAPIVRHVKYRDM